MVKFIYNVITKGPKGPLGVMTSSILETLSFLYFAAIKLRCKLYKNGFIRQHLLTAPVISIGNITWGGTGKTPLVEAVCSYFTDKGKKTAVLIRGYGSDEDKLLELNLPKAIVASGKDRLANAKALQEKERIDLFLLDDGFQHLKIKRDIDIVIVDASNPFGRELLLPAGILREPIQHLTRADMLVLTRTDMVSSNNLSQLKERLIRLKPSFEIFEAEHEPVDFLTADGNILPLGHVKSKKVCIVSALGNNESFARALKGIGIEALLEFSYIDHYKYTSQDIRKIADDCRKNSIGTIITTQKDWIKIKPLAKALGAEIEFLILRIKLRINNEKSFFERLSAVFNS